MGNNATSFLSHYDKMEKAPGGYFSFLDSSVQHHVMNGVDPRGYDSSISSVQHHVMIGEDPWGYDSFIFSFHPHMMKRVDWGGYY